MERRRIVIADDHPGMRERIVDLLSPEFEIVATLADGRSAFDAVTTLQPELVVLDISMPVMDGFQAAAQLAGLSHPPRVVFLTVHDDPQFIEAARDVGATAYVLKRAIARDLVPAIRLALCGTSTFPANASARATVDRP